MLIGVLFIQIIRITYRILTKAFQNAKYRFHSPEELTMILISQISLLIIRSWWYSQILDFFVWETQQQQHFSFVAFADLSTHGHLVQRPIHESDIAGNKGSTHRSYPHFMLIPTIEMLISPTSTGNSINRKCVYWWLVLFSLLLKSFHLSEFDCLDHSV